jgi:Flp pilus assembly protein CpaB
MQKRSNLLLLVGVAAFVVGAALVVSILRNDDEASTAVDGSKVLVAAEAIPAGTSGADMVGKQLVTLKSVPADARADGVLVDPAQLSGRVLDVAVSAGEQVRASALRPVALRSGAITIPPGKQGVAVQLPFVAGGAGYVGSGDLVNIYGNVSATRDAPPTTKLVLGNVKVLDVSNEIAPRVQTGEERAAGTNVTYLLALDPNEAERVIYLAANAQIWLALANGDGAALPATSGRTGQDVLK